MSDSQNKQEEARAREAELRAQVVKPAKDTKFKKPEVYQAMPEEDEPQTVPMEDVIKRAIEAGGSAPEAPEVVDPADFFKEDLTDAPTYTPEDTSKPLISTDTSDATLKAMLRVAEAMEKITARQEEFRQVPIHEVKPVSSFNPEGRRDHPNFSRPTYMDGIILNPLMHSRVEIELFNKIKPGRYWDRKIEVRRGSAGEIDLIRIGSKRDDIIMRNAKFPNLETMLRFIIAEREFKEQRRRAGTFDEDEVI